ncbi:hypothetical protein BCR37DRAFT_383505 [Protomyces lactucae-debilis]|uniref:Chitin-binding type-4 domain-containing protein n=1 Tax=Protomyces lactucae-debilis TaxID=2754530 RepID=A0A1Y2EXS1_PROLT|nr:uncharacterized protein BCR37DRAFT_383505 [Protomyces lactucae-debilis]ORY76370.1 hypothetical protein BCR37DRAFT_383505 [Protomyces lactucae-debilis]
MLNIRAAVVVLLGMKLPLLLLLVANVSSWSISRIFNGDNKHYDCTAWWLKADPSIPEADWPITCPFQLKNSKDEGYIPQEVRAGVGETALREISTGGKPVINGRLSLGDKRATNGRIWRW